MSSSYSRVFRQTNNPLLSEFLSEANIAEVQRALIRDVRRKTGVAISEQSEQDLVRIMTSVFHTYADTFRTATDPASFGDELRRLNRLTVDEAATNVLSGMRSHFLYVRDASQMYTPLDRPVNTTEDRTLQMYPI